MPTDLKKRRRQVAWSCFQPLLTQQQLIEAIRILEQGYQADSVSNLIAYVTKICTKFDIEPSKSILLYSQFREQMKLEPANQQDPLSLMLAQNAVTTTPLNPMPLSPDPKPMPTPVSNARPSPHGIVFTSFMQKIVADIPEKSALFTALKELANDPKQRLTPPTMLINRWLINPDYYDWANALDEKTLARVVHLVYTALCELFGPIEADEYFHKAIAKTDQEPEAKQFPPTRFL